LPPNGAQQVTADAGQGSSWQVTVPSPAQAATASLDLAFVLDTTGSMSDELSYINSELDNIVERVSDELPNLSIRYGLVVYRDHGDDYVTRSYDFTSDLVAFRSTLAQQWADGGGDFEEAVDEAVAAMNALSWRDGNVARVAFHVADAPPHPGLGGAYLKQVDAARKAGIRYFPVAASGIDDRTELLMREGAQFTSARYVFLTNDSGIGGEHAEPHIPCYFVQYLNVLMPRLIISELTGAYVPPDPAEVLRTGGDPQNGVCELDDGTSTRAY